jgi:hypothetical protein
MISSTDKITLKKETKEKKRLKVVTMGGK